MMMLINKKIRLNVLYGKLNAFLFMIFDIPLAFGA